jgi:hypothetical protein
VTGVHGRAGFLQLETGVPAGFPQSFVGRTVGFALGRERRGEFFASGCEFLDLRGAQLAQAPAVKSSVKTPERVAA